jgi:ketosteroid isomerase-like protein
MQRFASRIPLAASLCNMSRAALLALVTMASFAAHADEASDVQKLMAAGKPAEALQKADQYLASKPRDPMMRFLRGISLSQMGKTSEAITAFTKLTEDYPDLPEPFNNLAVLYAQQGQYDKARTALEMAIRTNPSYATAYENLGDVYAKLASQAYSKALQIDTRSAVAPKLAMIRDLFPKDRALGAAVSSSSVTTPVAAPAASPVSAKPVAAPPAVVPAPSKPTPVITPTTPKVEAKPETKPAVKPETKPGDGDVARREVEAAVRAWSVAWSRKDMDSYFAAYARDYAPAGKSRKAWEAERRSRIGGKRNISLKLSDVQVSVTGERASVRFHQAYKADALEINGHKSLELMHSGGSWLIVKESAGS